MSQKTILPSNTSSHSITEVAAETNRPYRVIGMHVFNPAIVMKSVEIIKGMATSQETFDAIKEVSVAIGKEPVEVADLGIVIDRMLIPIINEAVRIIAEDASAVDFNIAMMLGNITQ